MRESATGVITYKLNGEIKELRIHALHSDEKGLGDNEETLKTHLSNFFPKAEFISGIVIPDSEQSDK